MNTRISSIAFFFMIVFFMLLVSKKCNAIDCVINFTGTGTSNNVDSVIVQNLTKRTTVKVSDGNSLTLTIANSINQPSDNCQSISIIPNPIIDCSTVKFSTQHAGVAQISVYNLSGLKICDTNRDAFVGENSFQLSLPKGLFVLKVAGNGYQFLTKVFSQNENNQKPIVSFLNTGEYLDQDSKKQQDRLVQKRNLGTIILSCDDGDRLLYKGYSGRNCTIISDTPVQGKTIEFTFVDCTDGNNNSYPVVLLNNRLWMAENLRTTCYRNGDSIPNLTSSTAWGSTTSGAFCYYNNETDNAKIYGGLYNWMAVNDDRKIAPTGWHVPTKYEWEEIMDVLGTDCGKLLASSVGWNTSKIVGAIGYQKQKNNYTGFNGLPAGSRQIDGIFWDLGYGTDWWCSTYNYYIPYYCGLYYESSTLFEENYQKGTGLSIRCLWGENPKMYGPSLSTTAPSHISYASAISGGKITNKSGNEVIASGICWSTNMNPTADLVTKTIQSFKVGTFKSTLFGLTPGNTYYVRAYASTNYGTYYGENQTITTKFVNPADFSDTLYTILCGGYGHSKTYMLDVNNHGVSHYYPGPLTFAGLDEAWYSFTDSLAAFDYNKNGKIESWSSCYNYSGATWMFPLPGESITNPQDNFGTMTFSLEEGIPTVTVNHKTISSRGKEVGYFELDVNKHTMKIYNASPLHDMNRDGQVVDWGDLRIMKADGIGLTLAVEMDYFAADANPYLFAYNYCEKEYFERQDQLFNGFDPENDATPILSIPASTGLLGTWSINVETPFNWVNSRRMEGRDPYSMLLNWTTFADYLSSSSVSGYTQKMHDSLVINNTTITFYADNTCTFKSSPSAIAQNGTYYLDPTGTIITFAGVKPIFHISYLYITTSPVENANASNQMRIVSLNTNNLKLGQRNTLIGMNRYTVVFLKKE